MVKEKTVALPPLRMLVQLVAHLQHHVARYAVGPYQRKNVTNAWHGCIVYLKTCQGVLAGFTFTSKNMPKEVGRFSLTSQQRSHNE